MYYSLAYRSRARMAPGADFEAEVRSILAVARTRNAQTGLTGALVFTDTHFTQVIEGDKVTVEETYARIAHDPRHDRIVRVCESMIGARRFGDWSMGYIGPTELARRVPELRARPEASRGLAAAMRSG